MTDSAAIPSTSTALKELFSAARPLVERALDIAEQIAALREVATARGLDWSQVKALLKAQIQDERDDAGDGKRVRRVLEKADFASAYADMLGLGNMNEKYFSAGPEPHDPETGELPSEPPREGPPPPAVVQAVDVLTPAHPADIPDVPDFLNRRKVA